MESHAQILKEMERERVQELDNSFWEALHTGISPVKKSSSYNTGNGIRSLKKIAGSTDNESSGFSMNFDGIGVTPDDEQQQQQDYQEQKSGPKMKLSKNQAIAIKKYPTLIEFLGRTEGETIAKQIVTEINVKMADIINTNSKEANSYAVTCTADKHNLKQYFQADNWLCRVTASGPFTGEEAIYFSKDSDVACVLKKNKVNGEIKYSDISGQFNVVYDFEEIKDEAKGISDVEKIS